MWKKKRTRPTPHTQDERNTRTYGWGQLFEGVVAEPEQQRALPHPRVPHEQQLDEMVEGLLPPLLVTHGGGVFCVVVVVGGGGVGLSLPTTGWTRRVEMTEHLSSFPTVFLLRFRGQLFQLSFLIFFLGPSLQPSFYFFFALAVLVEEGGGRERKESARYSRVDEERGQQREVGENNN